MPGCQPRLHLPYHQWPAQDRLLWERAMSRDDPFATGAHLAKASRRDISSLGVASLASCIHMNRPYLSSILLNGSAVIASELFVLTLLRRMLPDLSRVLLVRSTTPRG